MNQVFSFKRYVWLLKRQWYENAAGYKRGIALMALLICAMFGLLLLIIFRNNISDEHFFFGQSVIFGATGILFLFTYGAKFFSNLTSKHKGIFYFSLPVSSLERIAVTFTFVVVFMPILILVFFNVFDFIAVQLLNHTHGTSEQILIKIKSALGSVMHLTSVSPMIISLLGYISYASIFTLGSLMFGKKGSVISIAFLIVFFVSCGLARNLFFNTPNSAFIIDYIKNYVYVYLLPICWTAMYFVMKRKES